MWCLTIPKLLHAILGLNQIVQVKAEWFDEPEWWEMFCCRLTLVKDAAKAR